MNPRNLVAALAFCAAVLSTTVSVQGQSEDSKNSTKKIRVKPNELAKQIGSAVEWQADLTTALATAENSNKPIFWYVPTLPNTFMDRKIEVHRYMMAGPFSWPAMVQTLNENAICVKAIPTAEQQEQFGLQRYKYVEPGFLILDSNGNVEQHVDQLTTLHPEWLLKLVRDAVGDESQNQLHPNESDPAWALVAEQDYAAAAKTAGEIAESNQDVAGIFLDAEMARGVAAFHLRKQEAARKIWAEASEKHPDHPLAWKLAAEAQGFGPFCRGFETFVKIPSGAMLAGQESRGSAAPNGVYSEPDLLHRGVDFLLAMQNSDGGFYDSDYDFGGTDSLKNVYVAVTSLAGMALLSHADTLEKQSTEPDGKTRLDRTKRAIAAAVRFVSDDQNLNKNDRDEILWAYSFRLRFLMACKAIQDGKHSGLVESAGDDKNANERAFDALVQKCIGSLESIQTNRGSWYHEYENPFVTATALIALQEAQTNGYQVDGSKVESGVSNLLNDRFDDGSYPYGTSRSSRTSRTGSKRKTIAAAGRMPLCELALYRLGKSDDQKMLNAVQKSFEHHEIMARAYKYDNHTDSYVYGGFFFWYDMRSRSEAIGAITDPGKRQEFRVQQRKLILELPEVDGCFVDSHELGRVYGTAMALISLDLINE